MRNTLARLSRVRVILSAAAAPVMKLAVVCVWCLCRISTNAWRSNQF